MTTVWMSGCSILKKTLSNKVNNPNYSSNEVGVKSVCMVGCLHNSDIMNPGMHGVS